MPERGPSLREPSFSGLQAQVSLALLRDSRHHPPKARGSAGEQISAFIFFCLPVGRVFA